MLSKGNITLIVLHLIASIQDILFATSILKAMQVHLDACFNESLGSIKHIDDPAIVGWIRHIESYDM